MLNLRYFLLIILLTSNLLKAQQTCTGALGDPIIEAGTDFGRGTSSFGSPTPLNTTYKYVAGTPRDGFYTLAKTTAGMNSSWHQNIRNHTPNDPDGYMMVVNADYSEGIFYTSVVRDLCPNTTYEFAAYIINILNRSGIKPNIKFTIKNDGVELPGGFSTGDIMDSSNPQWNKYSTTFITPSNIGVITLTMSNINPGGTGNDLALDDITFRACGPDIRPSIVGINTTSQRICEGENVDFNFSVEPVSVYTDPAYQWQRLENNAWVDITGATQRDYILNVVNARIGTYLYRMAVAERVNIASLRCRVVSEPLTITVNKMPIANAENTGPYCVGGTIMLSASDGDSYTWTGPNNFSSNEQNPIISNVDHASNGDYTVTVTSNNCSSQSVTTVNILDQVVGSTNTSSVRICENTGTQLIAYGGNSYTWSPAEGLSNTNTSETFVSPKETTIYQVKISNGACSETKEIEVRVEKNSVADAGQDQKIVAGTSIVLNGQVGGDGITYFWTPSEFLDDPTKLNPVATPTSDITYTLNVISENCVSSSDEVFIKVYPKIEIPNSFSPNGDGYNDLWNIPAALSFSNPQLKIMNRYGQSVYESKGNFKPWDGKFNGKELPVGSYFYKLYLNDEFQTYSGWVFLTR